MLFQTENVGVSCIKHIETNKTALSTKTPILKKNVKAYCTFETHHTQTPDVFVIAVFPSRPTDVWHQ